MMNFRRKTVPFIFTVISEEYAKLGLAWGGQVTRLTGIVPHFVCSDAESLKIFTSAGFPCTPFLFESKRYHSSSEGYGDIHFPSEKAVFTVSLKFAVVSRYLKAGRSVFYSDVDAIWMKDPLPKLGNIDADFLFQPGSFPESVKKIWGFSVCTGFFFVRSNARTIPFSDAVHEKFDGDDQRTLNDILVKNYDIEWSSRPKNWEHCLLQDGWTEPVTGACRKTCFTAAALPHSFYQRHGTHQDMCGHAIICHPNSPKDQKEKFEILRELGIDLEPLLEAGVTKSATPKASGFLSWIGRRFRRN